MWSSESNRSLVLFSSIFKWHFIHNDVQSSSVATAAMFTMSRLKGLVSLNMLVGLIECKW